MSNKELKLKFLYNNIAIFKSYLQASIHICSNVNIYISTTPYIKKRSDTRSASDLLNKSGNRWQGGIRNYKSFKQFLHQVLYLHY